MLTKQTNFDPDLLAFVLRLDTTLRQSDGKSNPLDPEVVASLFDESAEVTACLCGRPQAASRMRDARYRDFRTWLDALAAAKTGLQRARIESHAVPFPEIVRFEASVRKSLLAIRLYGELHFRAWRGYDRRARRAAENLAGLLSRAGAAATA